MKRWHYTVLFVFLSAVSTKSGVEGLHSGTSDEADCRFIMYFLTEDSPIPKPFYNVATEIAAIFLPFRDMAQFVDLLRNEEPLSVVLDGERPEWNYFGTTREPIGEAE